MTKKFKKVKIGLIFLMIFTLLLPTNVLGKSGKDKGKIGKSADFSFIYSNAPVIPEWNYFPIEGLECNFFEMDGVWNAVGSGTTDSNGLISFDVKKNTQYKIEWNWDGVLQEIIVENPSAVEVINLDRGSIAADLFYLNMEIPTLLTDSLIDLYYWNTTLLDWVIVSTVMTSGGGSASFMGLIMGDYSFDQITTYTLVQTEMSLFEPEIYIEPIKISNSEYKNNQA